MSFLQEYRNRPRRVVFYGRVSTEHEAQVSALDNQMDWYQELAARNLNWEVVGQYVDEGITGTQATRRPFFMQMIRDAERGKFDLVVTREVCRFARNTMDTLFYTRKLSKLGVEVYFAADSIWTMDNEGELRLTIMATMAQEESRKTSERVRAGIQMSREKGVLFGNGNILGYDLDKAHNTYVINEEQAETVRMIFEQYATGDGLGKVAKALIAKGRKDGGGHMKWDSSKITRILRNPTYMGYCVYNRTRTTDLLDHTREKNNDEETYILKKGNFTPIIDEELWHRCNDIRKSRQRNLLDENGKPRKYGGTVAKNVWVTKLVCHCGSKLRRYLWNTKADGTQVYGFECYRHKKQSALYLKKHGLPEGICELKAFPEWKLELMALKIFETVWGNRREAVLEACRMLNACYREESADPAKLKALDKRMDALNQRLDNLIMMKASNQITLNQFVEQSNEIGVQQQRITKEKAELLAKQGDHKTLDMDSIEASLCEVVDFTDGMVSEWFIQNFVRRITPIDDTRFAWVLDLAPEPQTLVCEVNGRKEYPRITLESNLYRGAWPPPGASRQTFLINRNGRLNGDISAAGLAQDNLRSRFIINKRVVCRCRFFRPQRIVAHKQQNIKLYANTKRPLYFPKGNAEGVFLCRKFTALDNQANIFDGQNSFESMKFCSLGTGQKANRHQPVKKCCKYQTEGAPQKRIDNSQKNSALDSINARTQHQCAKAVHGSLVPVISAETQAHPPKGPSRECMDSGMIKYRR